MHIYPAGFEAGIIKEILNMASHNVTLVGKIDDTGTTDPVTTSKSMPPLSHSSIVPTESSLAIAVKPQPQYDDINHPPVDMDVNDDVTKAMRDKYWNQYQQEAHEKRATLASSIIMGKFAVWSQDQNLTNPSGVAETEAKAKRLDILSQLTPLLFWCRQQTVHTLIKSCIAKLYVRTVNLFFVHSMMMKNLLCQV